MTECPCCGADSDLVYRCDECGKLLEADGESAGRDGGVF